MAHDVFISYSNVDKAIADATCATLENAGIRCWIAPRDITPGLEYGGAIVRAIDQCRVLVLIFSSNANSSRQIPREVERAINHGVPVVPVRVENVAPTESLAYYMESVHWLDALTPPLESHLQRLAESVQALLVVGPREDGARPPAAAAIPHSAKPAPAASLVAAAFKPSFGVKFALLASIAINAGLAMLAALYQDFPDFVVVLGMIGASFWLCYRNLGPDPTTAKFTALACAAITSFFILENVRVNAAPNWVLAGIEAVSVAFLMFVVAKLPGRKVERG
jgi:TIR domain